MHKIITLIYSVVTPVLNPIIYSLLNRNMKFAFHQVLCVKRITQTLWIGFTKPNDSLYASGKIILFSYPKWLGFIHDHHSPFMLSKIHHVFDHFLIWFKFYKCISLRRLPWDMWQIFSKISIFTSRKVLTFSLFNLCPHNFVIRYELNWLFAFKMT